MSITLPPYLLISITQLHPLIKITCQISYILSIICIAPVILLAALDILGWAVFKLFWRPLGYYPQLTKFKDPPPATEPAPIHSKIDFSLISSQKGLKRQRTLPSLRLGAFSDDEEVFSTAIRERNGNGSGRRRKGGLTPLTTLDGEGGIKKGRSRSSSLSSLSSCG